MDNVVSTVLLEEKLVNQITQEFHTSIEFTQLDSLDDADSIQKATRDVD